MVSEEDEDISSTVSVSWGTLRDVDPHTVRKHSIRGIKRIVRAERESSSESVSSASSSSTLDPLKEKRRRGHKENYV